MVLARDKNIKAHGSTGSSDTGSRYQLCGGMVTQVAGVRLTTAWSLAQKDVRLQQWPQSCYNHYGVFRASGECAYVEG